MSNRFLLASIVSLLLMPVIAEQALATTASSAGMEFGGNGTMLITDPSVGAFGVGAGLQGSFFFKMWADRPISAKFRLESVSLKEVASQKSGTDYLLNGSSLKSLNQPWTLVSVGAEGDFSAQGQVWFWEALLGYAIGASSTVTVTPGQPDLPLTDISQTTSSGFALSGGLGIKRNFSKMVIGLMTLRTLFIFGPDYSSVPLASKTYIPLPLMFNIGLEVPFNL